MSAPRDDKAVRRERLRRLDIALAGEVEQAGALSLDELQDEVRARELLGRPTRDGTIQEWWEYALRRAVLEEAGAGTYRLSTFGREQLAASRARSSAPIAPAVRRTIKYALPSGVVAVVGTAVAIADKNPGIGVGLIYLIGFLLVLLLAAEFADKLSAAFIDPRVDKKAFAYHAAWLDGDTCRWLWKPAPGLPEGTTMRRLYTEEVI